MPALLHTHTYIKFKNNHLGRKDIFKCNDPHCRHFDYAASIEGKASLCSLCGEEFILTKEDLKRAKPRCEACSTTKKAREKQAISSLIEEVISEKETQDD